METSDASFDNVHQTTILKSVKNLGEKPATTVRIFERNNFYYIFEEDGQLAAKYVQKYASISPVLLIKC